MREEILRFPSVLLWTLCTSLVLGIAFLLAPAMGTDLAAQVARADFFAAYGWSPIDFGWYGGVSQFGYSLFTASLGALIGVRLLGVLAAVTGAAAFQLLLLRGAVRRPLLGGLLGSVVLVANLVSGRVTFAVGLALGLIALVIASGEVGSRSARRWRVVAVLLLGALCTWASPVAGLFVGLAGAALLLAPPVETRLPEWRPGPRWPEAVALCCGPVLALAPMALLFGNGGRQPFTAESMKIHVALCVLVILLVPSRYRGVRVGAGLAVVLLLGAFYLSSPIGSNALRLPMLFTVPVLAALADLSWLRLAPLLAATFWWQPFVVIGDVTGAGSPESRAAFYQPLTDELVRRAPGRVEVVPLRDHWESAYVAARVPLARGWERQVDTDRNPLFYHDALDPQTYARWLRDNAVSYVAVAPASVPDRYARAEAALVLAGMPGLREVWRDSSWRLYEVAAAEPLVTTPAVLVASDRGGVTVDAPAAGDVVLRVRWSRWLSLRGPGGCLKPGPQPWTTLRVTTAGRYRLTSALRAARRC